MICLFTLSLSSWAWNWGYLLSVKPRPGFSRPIQFVSVALQKSSQPAQSQTDLLGRAAGKKRFHNICNCESWAKRILRLRSADGVIKMGSQLYPLHIPHREIQTGKQIILNRKENEKYARKSDGKFVSNVSSSNDGTSNRSRFPLFPLQPPLRAFFFPLIYPWIVLPLTKVNKTNKKRETPQS